MPRDNKTKIDIFKKRFPQICEDIGFRAPSMRDRSDGAIIIEDDEMGMTPIVVTEKRLDETLSILEIDQGAGPSNGSPMVTDVMAGVLRFVLAGRIQCAIFDRSMEQMKKDLGG